METMEIILAEENCKEKSFSGCIACGATEAYSHNSSAMSFSYSCSKKCSKIVIDMLKGVEVLLRSLELPAATVRFRRNLVQLDVADREMRAVSRLTGNADENATPLSAWSDLHNNFVKQCVQCPPRYRISRREKSTIDSHLHSLSVYEIIRLNGARVLEMNRQDELSIRSLAPQKMEIDIRLVQLLMSLGGEWSESMSEEEVYKAAKKKIAAIHPDRSGINDKRFGEYANRLREIQQSKSDSLAWGVPGAFCYDPLVKGAPWFNPLPE